MERTKKEKRVKIMQILAIVMLAMVIFYGIKCIHEINHSARLINFAGMIRGGAQRVVKLEIAGENSDFAIKRVDSIIKGLQIGSEELDLKKLNDEMYQEGLDYVESCWQDIKQEINDARIVGYENTELLAESEAFFTISDTFVLYIENYSQKKANVVRKLEIIAFLLLTFLVLLIIEQYAENFKVKAKNLMLNEEAYTDKHTGLPNKNSCEMILNSPNYIEDPKCIFIIDLNNLKTVNDTYGHNEGDKLIKNFARILRESVPKEYFVGRFGGDEFILIINGYDIEMIIRQISRLNLAVLKYNEANKPEISYALGYAFSKDIKNCTMKELFDAADKNMYNNKLSSKKNPEKIVERYTIIFTKVLTALENKRVEGYYCDVKTGKYRYWRNDDNNSLLCEGNFDSEMRDYIIKHTPESERAEILEKMSFKNICYSLSKRENLYSYDFPICIDESNKEATMTAVSLGDDELGKLDSLLIMLEVK